MNSAESPYVPVFDLFIRESGSSVYPSSDPTDLPFDTFICNRCGCRLVLQAYGALNHGDPSFNEQIDRALWRHITYGCIKREQAGL